LQDNIAVTVSNNGSAKPASGSTDGSSAP